MKIEIHFEDGTIEVCQIVKRYNNGDYLLDRKKRKKMELVSSYNAQYLLHKYKNERYIFVDVYLKDGKGYEQARVKRMED